MDRPTLPRRLLGAALAVLLGTTGLATGLVALGAAPASAGEPVPCSLTVAQNPAGTPNRPPGTQEVRSVDISFEVVPSEPPNELMSIWVSAGSSEQGALVQWSDMEPGTYEFVQSGPSNGFYEPGDPPGRYLGGEGNEVARLGFQRQFGSVSTDTDRGFVYNVVYTITYTDCDVDGDNRPDSSDNCPTVANDDQRDVDRDTVGDACDPDADGDGADDSVDNCLWIPNDQTDSDGDGVGNTCDATPYPPAPTPTTPAPAPTTPAPAPTTTPTTPVATPPAPGARTVSLRHKAGRHALVGAVSSDVRACEVGSAVTLWQKRRGADRRLVVRQAGDEGRFRIRRVRQRATYYVTVAADAGCTGARSRLVRLRR